ncbi:MAG: uroporphyrinogen-III synthase [Rubrivivax sp.]|nr:uroporphyrinogen-III synthase [Rubrivivax sp.]
MRLIVTRPAAQAAPWAAALRELGLDAEALPLIGIAPVLDAAPVAAAWAGLADYRLVMFVSANAVEQFFSHRPPVASWPAGVLAGATGPGTTAALCAAGVPLACQVAPPDDAPRFDSEALWQQLSGRDWAGADVLVVRGEQGRDWLGDTLRQRGARVHFVAAYQRLTPTLDAGGRALLDQALAAPAQHLWLFSSSEALDHLKALAPGADWAASAALASHPRIVQAALAAGFGHVEAVAPRPVAVAAKVRSIQWPHP